MTPHSKKNHLSRGFHFFNVLFYSPSSRYCVLFEDNNYNPLANCRELFIKRQRKRSQLPIS